MTADVSTRRIEFTVKAQCASLKNSRQIVPVRMKAGDPRQETMGTKCPYCGKRQWLIPAVSAEAKEFQREFKKQLPAEAQKLWEMPVGVSVTIYYQSNRPDLDEAIIFDCMQENGVLKNDRQIVSKFVRKLIDEINPRVHVVVIPVLWDRSGKQPGLFLDDSQENPMEALV